MQLTQRLSPRRRSGQVLAVASAALMLGGAVCSATILSLDIGPTGQAVPSGFLSYEASPTTYGAITVSDTGGDTFQNGFYTRGVGGTSSLAALYQDFLFNNGYTQPINVTIAGLLPNATYDLRLYSFDYAGGGFNPTMQFTPTTGSGAPGTVTFLDTAPPTTAYQDSTVVTWKTDPSGTLAFNTAVSGAIYFYGARLDGLEILDLVIPEPSTVFLLGVGGLCLWRHARRQVRQ